MSNDPTRPVKPYENTTFLNGPDALLLRITAELIEPESRSRDQHIHRTIVFFGSARVTAQEKVAVEMDAIN